MDELQIQLRSTSLALNLGGFDEASKLVLIAAERIASLEADLKQMEWISVEDELPKDAKPVIIHGGAGHYSHKYKGWFTNMERDYHGEYLPIQWTVTHWMNFTSPPQEQDK